MSKEVGDVAFEAQSCYSLGNTYTLMENYHRAIDYHMKHLHFALQLRDKYVVLPLFFPTLPLSSPTLLPLSPHSPPFLPTDYNCHTYIGWGSREPTGVLVMPTQQ